MAKKQAEDTPLLKQYFAVKAQHPEAVLLYRVGDFYETYSDDAVLVSKVLGLVQTKRSNGDKEAVPMAGFPHHAIEQYLTRLIRAGYKVAVCDQLEDPKLVGSRTLVKRGVTEMVTPGIAFGENMLEQKEHNYLTGLTFSKDQCGAAFLDVSTGTFQVAQGSTAYIGTLIASLAPKEIVVQRGNEKRVKELYGDTLYVSTLDEWAFVYDAAVEKLKRQLRVDSLKGYAIDSYPLGVSSAGALIVYLEQTQHTGLANICSISRIDEDKFVWMDKFTIRNLEIFSASAGGEGVSLVSVIDKCCSPMGSRLLRGWLAMPSLDLNELNARYDIVGHFTDNGELLNEVQCHISNIGDLDRIISRAATGKIMPREVLQLGRGLAQFDPIRKLCSGQGTASGVCAPLAELTASIGDCSELLKAITETLTQDAAAAIGKGDVIAAGVSEELDKVREISRGGKDYLLKMQQREIERTGITSLKISYNNVFGYYIEVRNAHKDKVPEEWIRKQTLVNAERYITQELKEYEEQILSAEDKIYALESAIYNSLIAKIQTAIRTIQKNSMVIAKLDILAGFAELASENRYCRPEIGGGLALDIKAGRHPVIETLMKPGEEYVPNDIHLDRDKQQIIILTGPNMSGKSALLRQTALIVLLAQIGSFVPADSAKIGYFDKIFTRVGASDSLSTGQSTFMVEMSEMANILNNATSRSLLIIDEIGRGTSTFDGLSIAWAVLEYISNPEKCGAKALFATHYHELTELEGRLSGVKNYRISVKEIGDNIIFLRKIVRGGADKSFGIQVAKLAGLPAALIERAKNILSELEASDINNASRRVKAEDKPTQMSMIGETGADADEVCAGVIAELAKMDADRMTPMEALSKLYELSSRVKIAKS